jgi:hypothetical protein
MKPNTKIAIILIIGLLTASSAYYLLIYKPAHPTTPAPGNTGSGNSGSGNNNPAPIVTNPIGKVAYANQDGVKVLLANGTTYKVAKKKEWLGTILATETKGGAPFFRVSGDRYVAVGSVTYAI